MLKTKYTSKKVLVLVILALVVGLGAFMWVKSNNKNSSSTNPSDNNVNYSPPTEEEKQDANNNKQRIVEEDEKLNNGTGTPADTKKSVKPVITSAEQYQNNVEVSVLVSSIFEDGGTCTASFSKGSSQFSNQVAATKEGRSVYCSLISVPANQFPEKGEWSVSVTYNSASSYGVSDAKKFEVN